MKTIKPKMPMAGKREMPHKHQVMNNKAKALIRRLKKRTRKGG